MPIISSICGGLGNQMFQYAAGRALALRLGCDLKLDLAWYAKPGGTPRSFMLGDVVHSITVASKSEAAALRHLPQSLFDVLRRRPKRDAQTYVAEPHHQYWAGFEDLHGPVYLAGYWQSERYFAKFQDAIRHSFTFPDLQGDAANCMAGEIRRDPNAVAVHIRRGDYVSLPSASQFHGMCPPEYYREAIAYLVAQVGSDISLFIFTDDPDWARQSFDCHSMRATIADFPAHQASPWHDMYLMSLCKHHIIANSSFSWWGAWLANTNGIVCSPSKWFADPALDTRDVCPPSWVRLGATRGVIIADPPDLSVIMSVYNGERFLEEAIQSILDQSFINFEFIIIDDASTDNTSEILKKYSQKDSRIRIFRNEINRERSISRNIAIDKARSDLIAIMDADDYAMYWRLSAQFNFMHDNPDIAVCCGKLQLYEYPEVIWSSPISYEDIYAKLFFESCMYHPTAMYRKSIIDSLGRYDADSPYAEDYMLWFKVAINGIFPVANMDTVLTRYRIHNNKRREYVQCVSDAADTVRRKALATLNLFPNEREWQAHLWLISRFDMRTAEDVRDCRTWLERVEQATATLSPTLRPAFINELKRRWQQLFLRQEQLPLWVGLLYFSSTLADTTWRGIWFFCKTILKRTMRYAKIKILEWF